MIFISSKTYPIQLGLRAFNFYDLLQQVWDVHKWFNEGLLCRIHPKSHNYFNCQKSSLIRYYQGLNFSKALEGIACPFLGLALRPLDQQHATFRIFFTTSWLWCLFSYFVQWPECPNLFIFSSLEIKFKVQIQFCTLSSK